MLFLARCVAYASIPRTWEAAASLVYIVSSSTGREALSQKTKTKSFFFTVFI